MSLHNIFSNSYFFISLQLANSEKRSKNLLMAVASQAQPPLSTSLEMVRDTHQLILTTMKGMAPEMHNHYVRESLNLMVHMMSARDRNAPLPRVFVGDGTPGPSFSTASPQQGPPPGPSFSTGSPQQGPSPSAATAGGVGEVMQPPGNYVRRQSALSTPRSWQSRTPTHGRPEAVRAQDLGDIGPEFETYLNMVSNRFAL